ncbi:MAG: vWA domain-containing protein [bacterium]
MFRTALLLLSVIVFSATALLAQKQAPSNRLVLILDASGSMWGQIGGENKIVIARRVMKSLVTKLGADTQIGLVAYGHRREKDCEDIEIITPLSALNKIALAQQIEGLNPKGMTPITGAIRKAFETVPSGTGATTIVLFSDGLETCGGDPCQIVSQAKAGGANFVMHVIGFDVGKENVAQLECAAQAGGGLYLSAENADELAAAFERAVAPADPSNAFLSVKAVANNELIDVRVHVFQPGTRNEVAGGRTYEQLQPTRAFFRLSPVSMISKFGQSISKERPRSDSSASRLRRAIR